MTVPQGYGHDGNGRDNENDFDGEELYNDSSDNTPDNTGDHTGDTLQELELVEDDEPLPWLESDYDDEDEGVDTGRLIGFVLLSLVALALILAAAWYLLRDRPDPDLMPEGSTIEAPDGAIKERPQDAGGKTFEGTGNVAPGVGEGQTTEGRLATDEAPRPSIDAVTGSSAQATDGTTNAGNTSTSVGVQVGAYSSRDGAGSAWATLRGQTTSLNGFSNRIVEGTVDGSKVYRLQAVASDAASANRLCNALQADGIACQVK